MPPDHSRPRGESGGQEAVVCRKIATGNGKKRKAVTRLARWEQLWRLKLKRARDVGR